MSALVSLASFACVAACGGRAAPTVTQPARSAGGDRVVASVSSEPVLVDAASESAPMPTCTAGELRSLGSLTQGVAATPALARGATGGLLAYVIDGNHDGARELVLQPLDAQGAARGASSTITTGPHPSHPSLVARGEGFVLAWREGNPGNEKILARVVDASGSVAPGAPLYESAVGWFGPPSLALEGDVVHVAYTLGERPADMQARGFARLQWAVVGGRASTVNAPSGAHFDAESAPEFSGGSHQRLFALVRDDDHAHGDERALVEVLRNESSGDSTLALVARDVDAPSALAARDGGLLLAWRGHLGGRDVGPRVLGYAPDGTLRSPPVTAAVFRGAIDAEARLVSLGENLAGVFTLSTLSDDAGGTLNATLFTASGAYVGRQPLLTSLLVRSSRVVAAAGAQDVWFALEGRGDSGAAAIGLVSVRCDASRPANRLEVPPPSLVQRLSEVDEPPAASASACTNMATPLRFGTARNPGANVLANTSGHAVPLRGGWVLFHASDSLVAGFLDAQGHLGRTSAAFGAVESVLAVGAVGDAALAVFRAPGGGASVAASRGDRGARGAVATQVRNASSAVIARGASSIFLVGTAGDDPANERSLWRVAWQNGRAAAPVRVAHLHAGDRVLDAVHAGNETIVLLARPDGFGDAVGRTLAAAHIADRASAAQLEAQVGDPFADPLGHGRGPAVLALGAAARGTTPVFVAYAEGATLRAATLRGVELREPRSLARALPGGGAHLAFGDGDAAWRWVVLSSGLAEDEHTPRGSGLTLWGIEARATGLALAASTSTAPDDPGAIAESARVAARGTEALLTYARVESDGSLSWMAARASCAPPSRAANTNAPTQTPANAPANGGAR